MVLANEAGISARKLASMIGFDSAAVSRALKELKDRTLVRTERDFSHVRRQQLFLTDAGQALFKAMAPFSMHREDLLLQVLTDAEREMLISLLQRIAAHVQEASDWIPESGDV